MAGQNSTSPATLPRSKSDTETSSPLASARWKKGL